MATPDVKRVLRREGQLNALAYVIIVLLLGLIGTLIVPMVNNVSVPEIAILRSDVARTLFVGLILMFVLYLTDQHRKLRAELLDTHQRLESANAEISAAYERLSFAQHTASLLSSLTDPGALERVLGDAARHFGADAAAVVGDEVTLISEEGVDDVTAEYAVLGASLDVVRAGKALADIKNPHGGDAIAVPLRVRNDLKSVVCLWKQEGAFRTDQLEGLILMARIIELSMENRSLLAEVNDQLEGTLSVLSLLIDQRLPEYARSSTELAEHVVEVGRAIGLGHNELSDLKIAALLADIGMLQVSETLFDTDRDLSVRELEQVRMHPLRGAQLARSAHFSIHVQDAILYHHERLDGTGFPRGRRGTTIPVAARILAVCEVYDSMTVPRPGLPHYAPNEAIDVLVRGAGSQFDAEVVRAFLQVIGHSLAASQIGGPTDASARPEHERALAGARKSA